MTSYNTEYLQICLWFVDDKISGLKLDKYFLASFAIAGKKDEFNFHYSKGLESVSIHG